MSRRRLRSSNEGWLTSYADLITNLLIFFSLIVTASAIQTGKMEKIADALSNRTEENSLIAAEKKISDSIQEQNLQNNVSVKLTDDGLELAFDSGVVFASGSADLFPQVMPSLNKVLEVLKPFGNKYHVAVEGHTDEIPIKSGHFKSNWELSSGRAMKIRERLEEIGIEKKRIRVEAYADNKPLAPEAIKNLSRSEVLAKHRRVVIRLY